MWAPLHDSDAAPLLDGLIKTAYAFGALSIFCWFASYFRRRAQMRCEARELAAEAELMELILEQTAREQPDATPFRDLPRWRQRVLLRVLTSLLEQIQGSGRERLIALTRAMGARSFLQEALRNGQVQDRINAAIILGAFGDEMAASALSSALRDRNYGVRLAVARSLLNHPCAGLTLHAFLEALRFSDKDPSIALADIFDHLPPHWHTEAIAMLREGLSPNWRRMLAIALGRTRIPGAREAIASLLGEDDPRLRAAAWIGLAELGDSSVQPMLPQGLADPSADVRVTACHCARRLQAIGCIPALTRLLRSDKDWWVRYRAAQALAGMEAAGRSAILGAAGEASDAATDVGLLVLREHEAERAHA